MTTNTQNIFSAIPEEKLADEYFQTLLKAEHVHIERIISRGHSTPAGQWYDQAFDEWVLVLQGQASVCYEHEDKPVQLAAGDYLLIPAHTRHRVAWTASAVDTVWLVIHLH